MRAQAKGRRAGKQGGQRYCTWDFVCTRTTGRSTVVEKFFLLFTHSLIILIQARVAQPILARVSFDVPELRVVIAPYFKEGGNAEGKGHIGKDFGEGKH